MDKYTIAKVTPGFIARLLETELDGKYGKKIEQFGLFYWKEGMHWLGCDNTSGDCFIEQFNDIGRCLAWLIGEEEL